ncbi:MULTISPECIES: type II secretion system protein [unclassified Lentimonas]|uniref:type II secretion system protein n=1 Tax=unclassified Lentimonas TaxID=2630993 RepID=UPI001325B8AC|nr:MULTISPECIES: prepilin-type N-terminal cleavage/methylation domain-containing protein [unclassified Lentimonas]CAA6679351.1 Unannotated [Lentimonas sp. CC4]CAA6686983.1 Unannotated [Lentimonas sp. CC6]CAA6693112.1 Unannotated [Lentimonas sp. CC19]CAA6695626.1 Unannotated [Lentimonas sp. CC10]CAA7071504.1 Unannotated [Lentimonas sp. CC11]
MHTSSSPHHSSKGSIDEASSLARDNDQQRCAIRRRAFTLIELLTVIAIIGILAAILIPAIVKVREKAAVAKNTSNLRQLGSAVQLYAMEHQHYPPASSPTYESKMGYGGKRWPDLIANQLAQYPSDLFMSPTLDSELLPDVDWQPTNYAGNPRIFARGEGTKMNQVAQVQRSSAILLGDVTTKAPQKEHKNGHADFSLSFDPSDRSTWSQNAGFETSSGTGQPDFRNDGKAAFVFVDGHVELLATEELLRKHFAID